MPCRTVKGLECVFPIWFAQCGRVWFTLAMPFPRHAPTMLFFTRSQNTTAVSRRPWCGLEKNGRVGAWHGYDMASVSQTRPHCVNQMGKTHFKPLAARHGRGTAWARYAMCESALMVTSGSFCFLVCSFFLLSLVIYDEAFCLQVANNFFCIRVFCPTLGFVYV